jgi:hypothetical protein
MAYHNGKYKQAEGFEDAVYIQYHCKMLPLSRDKHKHMNGVVMHKDHPFWEKNLPMCDWNCKCFVTWHTKDECEDEGLAITTGSVANIAGADFAYDKRTWSYQGQAISKMDLDKSIDALPTIAPNEKYNDMSEKEIKQSFYKTLGLGKAGGVFIDKINDPVVIDDNLFKTGGGLSKIKKKDRHLYLSEFGKLIKDPDEMYLELEYLDKFDDDERVYPNHRIIKKFLKYYKDKNGDKRAMIAIFEYLKNRTQGVTLYFVKSPRTIENKRVEKLVYRKD